MPDIKSIVERMTLEEKAALCTGATAWTTTPVERLGVPEMTVSDGPHGVRRVPDVGSMMNESLPATCFPTASLMASSWDTELVAEVGMAIAEECISLGVDVVLGPGANMKRTPLCGRNFEYYSEDPYLAGEMAAGFIEGGTLVIDLTSRSLARMVELSLDGTDAVFSDNYFDLPAGRTVTVTCPLPEGWTAEQARAALRTRSVYDTYSQTAKE